MREGKVRPREEGDMAPRESRSRRFVAFRRMGVDEPAMNADGSSWHGDKQTHGMYEGAGLEES